MPLGRMQSQNYRRELWEAIEKLYEKKDGEAIDTTVAEEVGRSIQRSGC